MYIASSLFTKSHWSVVEQLPHVVYDAIPLTIDDKLYITIGYIARDSTSTCNVVIAFLLYLLQSINIYTNPITNLLTLKFNIKMVIQLAH